jgi:hypothetical protein
VVVGIERRGGGTAMAGQIWGWVYLTRFWVQSRKERRKKKKEEEKEEGRRRRKKKKRKEKEVEKFLIYHRGGESTARKKEKRYSHVGRSTLLLWTAAASFISNSKYPTKEVKKG